MKKERKATPFEYMGCVFLLGISKKFDRDLETVKSILDKPELTPADRVRLLMIYNPSFHDTGKIAGSTSFDSSAGNCIFCQKMRQAAEQNAGHICNYCYDMDQENRWKEVMNRHSLNMLIMQTVEFTVDELAILPATKINRINSSGDTPNKVYAKNMLNLAKANSELHFAYWAKNTRDVIAACDEIGKPENMTLVQSSYVIGRPAKLAKYFDFVFTVYATEDGIAEAIKRGAGECNGKKCMECGWKCYLETWKKAGVKEVAEILRTKKGTLAKLAAAGVK